jgi:ribosomal protein L11 methyltransferase
MEKYVELTFEALTQEQKDILIAQLSLLGFEGFEEQTDKLIACIPMQQFDGASLLENISSRSYSEKIIEQQNWNEEWEKSFQPVHIDDFCVIRASFHQPVQDVAHEIIITPKMSFGTGHHATTWLMIQQMRKIIFNQKRVLDFGTGTGVLAILASKLDATDITAIDNDEWSIRNAEENFRNNGCDSIKLYLRDSLKNENVFDIILANINRHVILANLKDMKQHLANDGVLVLSGLLVADRDQVIDAACEEGLALMSEEKKDDWIALKLTQA